MHVKSGNSLHSENLITCTSISAGDRLGAQLSVLAALVYIGKKTGHKVTFLSHFIDYGVGIRFLGAFQFSPRMRLIGRQCRLTRIGRGLIDQCIDRLSSIVGASKPFSGLLNLFKLKYRGFLYKFERMRVCGKYGFTEFNLRASFPQDIPALEAGVNYDINGDFTMFIPLWVRDFFSVTPFICFKEPVLQNAKDVYIDYKADCGGKKLLGVHFRRGDYLAVSSLNLDLDYYARALGFFAPSE